MSRLLSAKIRRPNRRGSRHLFDRWAEVRARLASARHIMLFLDFDGTLAPLRPHPDDARLEPDVRKVIARLARHAHITVCLISGRRLRDLRSRAAVRGAHYIGLHGRERDGEGRPKPIPEFMRQFKSHLAHLLGGWPRIWVEDKGIGCAVHYRGASENVVRRARAALRLALAELNGQVQLLRGKKVWEILPGDVPGKGVATRKFLVELKHPALPIFVGDDTTDEPAFMALAKGITIRVGPARRTHAQYMLRDPLEVNCFLERLAELIP